MSFNDIIDQKPAVQILKDEIKTNRINHAYLFLGKDGVGKKTLAFQFARALLCKKLEMDSCDKCVNCRRIDHFNHPDVKLIGVEEESNNIKIDQVREMQKEISYKPYETDYKLYIIDEAEKMTTQAANSLLKTLEEPPDYAVIIILAEGMDSLLPTIVSRCQHIRLSGIAREKIKNKLLENGLEEERAGLLSRLARGSLGQALDLVENSEFLEGRSKVLNFLSEINSVDTINLFKQVEEMQSLIKGDFPLFNLLSSWYRDIIIYMKGNQDQVINIDYLDSIGRQMEIYNIDELLKIVELISEFSQYPELNVRTDLTLQVLFLKIRDKRL